MSSLITLLSDALALTLPGPPELELARPRAALALLSEILPTVSPAALDAAIARCAAGDLQGYEQLAMLLAPVADEPPRLGELASGLSELLALRGALLARPRPTGRVRLSAPIAFAALRRFSLPHSTDKPAATLVGRLADEPPIELGKPPAPHRLMEHIRVAFDGQSHGPLLTINVDSHGSMVPWQGEREHWRQPAGPAGELQVSWRDRYCTISTRQLAEAYAADRAGLLVEASPAAGAKLYLTEVLDERKRPLSVYLRAY